jgi:hypothetical protein
MAELDTPNPLEIALPTPRMLSQEELAVASAAIKEMKIDQSMLLNQSIVADIGEFHAGGLTWIEFR